MLRKTGSSTKTTMTTTTPRWRCYADDNDDDDFDERKNRHLTLYVYKLILWNFIKPYRGKMKKKFMTRKEHVITKTIIQSYIKVSWIECLDLMVWNEADDFMINYEHNYTWWQFKFSSKIYLPFLLASPFILSCTFSSLISHTYLLYT